MCKDEKINWTNLDTEYFYTIDHFSHLKNRLSLKVVGTDYGDLY